MTVRTDTYVGVCGECGADVVLTVRHGAKDARSLDVALDCPCCQAPLRLPYRGDAS